MDIITSPAVSASFPGDRQISRSWSHSVQNPLVAAKDGSQFTVHSNIDGASVAFDGVTKGTITSGIFTLEISTTGTPFTSYTVSRSGYVTYAGSISRMPASDQTIDLYATLNPVPTATTPPTTIPTTMLTPIGGDAGWYTVPVM